MRYSAPEFENAVSRSIKSGWRAILASKIPRIFDELDDGVQLHRGFGIQPELKPLKLVLGEALRLAEHEVPPCFFAYGGVWNASIHSVNLADRSDLNIGQALIRREETTPATCDDLDTRSRWHGLAITATSADEALR